MDAIDNQKGELSVNDITEAPAGIAQYEITPKSLHLRPVKRKKHDVWGVVVYGSVQQRYVKGFSDGVLLKNRILTVVDQYGHGYSYKDVPALLNAWDLVGV